MQQSHSPGPADRHSGTRPHADQRRGHPPAPPADRCNEDGRGTTAEDGGGNTLTWSFPGTPADVTCSRRWLAEAATQMWGEGEDTDRLVLAYSEIATNAVVHGKGPVSVAARISPTAARCEVADHSARLPRPRGATSDDIGGRGLEMVRATVDRLRVAADGIGKTVSFVVGRQSRSQGRKQ